MNANYRPRLNLALWIAVVVLASINLAQSVEMYRKLEARVTALEECE